MKSGILEDFITTSSPCKSNTYKHSFNNFDKNKLKKDLNTTDWNNDIYKDRENKNKCF